jgi:hypothetical protein
MKEEEEEKKLWQGKVRKKEPQSLRNSSRVNDQAAGKTHMQLLRLVLEPRSHRAEIGIGPAFGPSGGVKYTSPDLSSLSSSRARWNTPTMVLLLPAGIKTELQTLSLESLYFLLHRVLTNKGRLLVSRSLHHAQ